MAITKLPRNGIADDAINDSKIEDGTVAITEVSGTITGDKFTDSTIANAKLSNSTFSIRGTSRALGASFSLNVDVDWQSVKTGNTTMVSGQGYFVDTSSGAVTMTLPSSASAGDTIAIKDYSGTFGSNNLTIGRNSHNIQGVANDSLIRTNRASVVLVYVDSTKGWLFTNEHNVADLGEATFTSATGGTITTSGDFKIHTFTGDGNFVVSTAGNSTGGGAEVSYVIVAGGGGAGHDDGGGGGAGGFRESRTPNDSYTVSPLNTAGGSTITATTFPVTVGGGGTGAPNVPVAQATSGSNSVFNSITSAGGGFGGRSPQGPGQPGGSGGGGGGGGAKTGGDGNTPSVSPPQGNNGGASTPGTNAGGGGGGAGAAGTNGSGTAPNSSPTGGNGGNGVTSSITGSSVARAGGGGGGAFFNTPGTGGTGGGAAGAPSPVGNGSPGTANTGGGGGAGSSAPGPSRDGGNGGKGVVIIRYKFQ